MVEEVVGGDVGLSRGISSALFHVRGWQAGGFRLGGEDCERSVCGQLDAGEAVRVAGEQGSRALCLMPGRPSWFIFRSKTQGFLSAVLKFLLGAGAVCPSRL